MKQKRRFNNLYRALGLIVGGFTGGFIGYRLGELAGNGEYDSSPTLSILLSLIVAGIGCIIGFFVVVLNDHRNGR